MFGPEDEFFNQLAALARVMPVLPLFGSGAVKLQPVYVGDVAEAVAKALVRRLHKAGFTSWAGLEPIPTRRSCNCF
jgi:uncharacterized protein YbjT (DUF2867 family)